MTTDEETRMAEGAALRFLIKGRGMSQAQLASITSTIAGGESMLSQRLNGVRPIPLDAGLAYAEALDVSVADFSPRLAAQVQAVVEAAGGEQGLRRHMRASELPAVDDGRLLAKLELTDAERKRAIEAAAAAVAEASPRGGFP